MPTLTGHETAAVDIPRAWAALISVGTWMVRAYQYQALLVLSPGSNTALPYTPWTAGGTPVISVVCEAYVTVGTTPTTPSAYAPSRAKACSVGRRAASGPV